jgi:hypothetical protein
VPNHLRRANKNRIVRVRNKVIWELVRHASWQTGLAHQICFDELMDMISEGFVIGSETHWALFVRLTDKMKS